MPNAGSIVIWSLVLIAVLIGMFLLVGRIKHWLHPPAEPTGGAGFTLSDLRQFHREGKMSDEEFEKAKSKIIDAAQKLHARPAVLRGQESETKLDR